MTGLEDRIAPAVATWDGGGATDHWTDPQNWTGDVAPLPGDDLAFPTGAARLTTVNDFPAGATFGQLRVTANAYRIAGNAVSLAGGITADLPFGASEPDSQIEIPRNGPARVKVFGGDGADFLDFASELLVGDGVQVHSQRLTHSEATAFRFIDARRDTKRRCIRQFGDGRARPELSHNPLA